MHFGYYRLAWAGLLPIARLVEATLDEWEILPAEVEGGVNREQLVAEKSTRMAMDRSLLSCLVDRWRPETHTFHFPWGEMAPTLEDVSMLLGLPLAGEPIGPTDPPHNWLTDLPERFAGVRAEVKALARDTHGPRLGWLAQFEVIKNRLSCYLFIHYSKS